MARVDAGQTAEDSTKNVEAGGFFEIDQRSKIILLVIAVVSLIYYVPVIVTPDISLFGLPWLFVVLPVGMVIISFAWLLAAYTG